MAALTGRTIRASYIELLKLNTASTNTGVTGSLIDVTDGGDTASALSLSTSQIASSVDGSAGTAAFTRKGDTNTGVFFPAADTIAATTNGTERMRIDSSGNVGIGTTAPATLLDVSRATDGAAIRISSQQNDSAHSLTTPYGSLEIYSADGSGEGLGVKAAIRCYPNATAGGSGANLAFTVANSITNDVERMRITSTGNVGIGTTSPSAQLELSTDSAKKPSTNTWTIASDQRLKTNITNADNDRCYEIVKQVPLKRYTWKSEVYSQEQVKDRSKLGWIAQDVEAVFPKAVGTNRFAYNQVFENVVTPELDSDGNTVLDENGVAKTKTEKRLVSEDVIEDCKDLNSDQIYAAMYGTIQKLIEKVEFLESKVATLEAA